MKWLEATILWSLECLFGQILSLRGKVHKDARKGTAAALEGRIARLKQGKLNLYELYAEEMMGKEEYLAKKGEMQEEIVLQEEELREARRAEDAQREKMAAVDKVAEDAEMFTGKLTDEIMERFIDTVYVYDPERIKIVYKLEDMVKRELGMVAQRSQ